MSAGNVSTTFSQFPLICLKVTHSKNAGNHGMLRPKSTNFQSLLFIPIVNKLLLYNLKWKGKRKRCLGGLGMKNQHEQGPQTFLVSNFSFLQLWQKQDDLVRFQVSFEYRLQIQSSCLDLSKQSKETKRKSWIHCLHAFT